jgi:hypothetical protein
MVYFGWYIGKNYFLVFWQKLFSHIFRKFSMKKVETPKNVKELPLAIVKQMATLATSGFGLVAALAWNNVIQEFIANYIKPYVGLGSGFISMLIYAIIVTVLAVFVTLQLSKIQQRLESRQKTNP